MSTPIDTGTAELAKRLLGASESSIAAAELTTILNNFVRQLEAHEEAIATLQKEVQLMKARDTLAT